MNKKHDDSWKLDDWYFRMDNISELWRNFRLDIRRLIAYGYTETEITGVLLNCLASLRGAKYENLS